MTWTHLLVSHYEFHFRRINTKICNEFQDCMYYNKRPYNNRVWKIQRYYNLKWQIRQTSRSCVSNTTGSVQHHFRPVKTEIWKQPGNFSNPTTVSKSFLKIQRQRDLQHMLDLSDFEDWDILLFANLNKKFYIVRVWKNLFNTFLPNLSCTIRIAFCSSLGML